MSRAIRRVLALVSTLCALAAVGGVAPGPAAGLGLWMRPVDGRVARPFRAPLTRYGAGHLGVDLVAAPGTSVRAAGAGTVVFAGLVAAAMHVVVGHPGGVRTSYSFLASIRVREGDVVARGTVLGTTGGHGEGHDRGVLHLGLRVGGAYVDPMQLFGPPDLAAVVHLAPVPGDTSAAPVVGIGQVPGADFPATTIPPRPTVGAAGSGGAGIVPEPVVFGRRTAAGRPLYPR